MPSLDRARITVTRGAGFLGSHLVPRLRARGAAVTVARSRDYDLVSGDAVRRLLHEAQPEIVIHLAGLIGGIGANREQPGRFLYDNVMMGVQLLEEARRARVAKVVVVGTVCAYPKHTPVPFREDDLWNGYPEETNAPYGIAKKLLLVQGQAYRQQYGFSSIHLLPVNLFGPGDDDDPNGSHVIPALIRKCLDAIAAGADTVELWGTGDASREFLYVEDGADGIVLATERYDDAAPVNLGSGREMTIRELADAVAAATGFRGRFAWDASKPDGQPRRRLDVSRAERCFGFRATPPFEEGLARTVAWYRQRRATGA